MGGVTGVDKALARIRKLATPASQRRIGAAVFVGSNEVATEARLAINEGAVSGKNHVVSHPGEPPNSDTHHLEKNVVTIKTGELTAIVESQAGYGLDLEFGTEKMAARPYMKPAADKKRGRVVQIVRAVVAGILRS